MKNTNPGLWFLNALLILACLAVGCHAPWQRTSESDDSRAPETSQSEKKKSESDSSASRNGVSEESTSGAEGQDLRPAPENPELHPPLDPPLVLTGTTGEYRRSHFHYGIDLSSDIGDPVYAVRSGYVSRIIYDGYGLGYGIWITHADGRRSKYGHLSAYAPELLKSFFKQKPELEKWLSTRQRFDLRFEKNEIAVERGQTIALTGDTGSGPSHLHFEYLDGERVLNPLNYGLRLADDRAPLVESLVLIPCEADARINAREATISLAVDETSECGAQDQPCNLRQYTAADVTVNGKTCLQVRYFDPSGKYARLGIADLRMTQDGKTVYSSTFDSLIHTGSFHHLILYSESSRIGGGTRYIHNAFDLLPGQFSFLSSVDHGRLQSPKPGESSQVIVQLQDAGGNRSVVSLSLKNDSVSPLSLRAVASTDRGWSPYTMEERLRDSMDPSSGVGRPGKDLNLRSPDGRLRLEVGPRSLTGAVRFQVLEEAAKLSTGKLEKLSPVYNIRSRNLDELTGIIFRERIFVLDPLKIHIEDLQDNDGLYRITDSGALYPVAYSRNGKLTGYVRSLEKYIILKDRSNPVIRAIPDLRTRVDKPVLLSLRYFADYGTGVNVGSLELEVNGKPALAEWNPDRYGFEIFYPPEILASGKHTATVRIQDYAGNWSGKRSFSYQVQ